VQDRAVGPFVAGATPDQRLERRGHLQHALDAPVQLVDVLLARRLTSALWRDLSFHSPSKSVISATEKPRSRERRMKCSR
jgi:hypothetical protein